MSSTGIPFYQYTDLRLLQFCGAQLLSIHSFVTDEKQNVKLLETLLEDKTVNINVLYHEKPAIYWAAVYSKLEVVQLLIEKGANINTPGDTPLHGSCYNGDIKMAKLLLDNGANINAIDTNERTPLYWASLRYPNLAQYLLEKGADFNIVTNTLIAPLHNASLYGYIEIVRILISKGADINIKDINEKTPLYYACSKGQLEVINYLLQQGVRTTDYYGLKAMKIASSNTRKCITTFKEELNKRRQTFDDQRLLLWFKQKVNYHVYYLVSIQRR